MTAIWVFLPNSLWNYFEISVMICGNILRLKSKHTVERTDLDEVYASALRHGEDASQFAFAVLYDISLLISPIPCVVFRVGP